MFGWMVLACSPLSPVSTPACAHADVILGRRATVGTGSAVLLGLTLEDGVALGVSSPVGKSCRASGSYAGNPARRIRERQLDLLGFERPLMANNTR